MLGLKEQFSDLRQGKEFRSCRGPIHIKIQDRGEIEVKNCEWDKYHTVLGRRFRGILDFGEVLASEGAEFAADNVGGEAGTEEAAVDGGQFSLVDFAAVGAKLALDALADHGGFVRSRGD